MGASHTFTAIRRDEKPLTQRLLLPVVGMAVLLLGGLGFLYAMFSSHRDHKIETAPAPKVSQTPSKPARTYAPSIDDDVPAPPEKAPERAPVVAPVEKKAEPEAKADPEPEKPVVAAAPAVADPPMVAALPEKKPNGDPYMVPENKPFIDRDTFGGTKPKAPATATGAAAPAPAPKPAEPAAPPPPPPAPATTVQNTVYVLFSGKRINAVSTIEMGDCYGVKDAAGNFVKIKKADVSNVIKPQP
jgi:hypothetical protein